MSQPDHLVRQATAIAIDGRALLLEGPPGIGKTSLALALIDRGAVLIGDDGVSLERRAGHILASPPPNIRGKIEVRGVGLISMPVAEAIPVSLILNLAGQSDRLPSAIPAREILGVAVPAMDFVPGAIAPAIRAETALARHGI